MGPSDAFASSTAAARRVGRRLTRLERLDLGAGSHVVFAKVVLSQTAEHATRVLCDLTAADTLDRFTVRLGARHSASSATVHLMLATELPASSPALLRCRYDYESATDVRAAFVQISAIRVGTLTVQ